MSPPPKNQDDFREAGLTQRKTRVAALAKSAPGIIDLLTFHSQAQSRAPCFVVFWAAPLFGGVIFWGPQTIQRLGKETVGHGLFS